MSNLFTKLHNVQLTEYISADFSYIRAADAKGNEIAEVVELQFYFTVKGKSKKLDGPFTGKLLLAFVNAEARYLNDLTGGL